MTRRLVTERDVRDAATKGQLTVGSHAVVTPAARDLAAQLHVRLDAAVAVESSAEPTALPGVVALGADHGGVAMKDALRPFVESLGYRCIDLGTTGGDPVDYPVFAARVAETVSLGEADIGIMVDGAGIGSAMVANKIPGVRAAMCYDVTTATNAREHNNANVLTLGGSLIGSRLAMEIAEVFLQTPFGGGRHGRRVAMIDALDSGSVSS